MSVNLLKMCACILAMAACTQDERPPEAIDAGKAVPQVYTVNYPLAHFAERIAGDAVNVVFPAPADADPAVWTPAAETVADYQHADLVLLNGAGYAKWIQRATLFQSRMVDTSAALTDQLIPLDDAVTHSHGPGGDHSHTGTAFTTWLDVGLAIGQARAVFDALVRLHPENESVFRQNLTDLELDLTDLDKRLQEVAGRIGDRPLIFSHPVYQYLARRYGLNGRSVHWEPLQMPDEEQWRELSAALQNHAAAWMIWEDEPHSDTVSRLARMGIESLVFRPCGNRPAEGGFFRVMQDNLQILEQAFPAPSP